MEDLKNNRAVWKDEAQSAIDELRMEFEDIRFRLRRTPEQFIVLSDLAVRSWRDPVVAKIFRKLDDGWHAHLVAFAGTWHPAGHISKQPECAAVREGDDGGPERYRLSIQTSASQGRRTPVGTGCTNGALDYS